MFEVREIQKTSPRMVFDLRDAFLEWEATSSIRSPRAAVRFFVTHRWEGGEMVPLAQAAELETIRNPSGFTLWFGMLRLPRGCLKRSGFEPGVNHRIRLESPLYSPFLMERPLDRHPDPLVVSIPPGHAYPFSGIERVDGDLPGKGPTLLRGDVHRTQGFDFEDARVQAVDPQNGQALPDSQATSCWASDGGAWVVVFHRDVPSGMVTLRFTARRRSAGQQYEVGNVQIVRGREARHIQTGLRGQVTGPRGTGLKGVSITVEGLAYHTISLVDGSWSLYFPPDQFINPGSVPVTVTAKTGPGEVLQHSATVEPRSVTSVEEFRFG